MTNRIDIASGKTGEQLCGEMLAAAQRASELHRMTYLASGERNVAAIVPLDIAVALDPGSFQLSGETHWTSLPAGGMSCQHGMKITQLTWSDAGMAALHEDGSACQR